MSDGNLEFSRAVTTENGYTLLYPNVAKNADLLESVPPNPYAESVTPLFPIGTRLINGRDEWYYCKNGSSGLATLGTPLQSPPYVTAEESDDIAVNVAAAIGDYDVYLTSTENLDDEDINAIDNDFAGGYLIVNDEAGQGQLYKIKSNEGFNSTDKTRFTLYDPLTVALTTSSEVGIVRSPHYRVVATTAPLSGTFVGVNLLAITANYFFWAKRRGYVPGNPVEAIACGYPVCVGATAAKFNVYDAAAVSEMVVGYPVTLGVANTEQFVIDLF